MNDTGIFDDGISTKGNSRGSGLYISKEIANRYKGYIEVNPGEEMIQFIVGLPF